MKTVREMIEVMEAFDRGETVEWKPYAGKQSWLQEAPAWNWLLNDYRIVPETPDTIDWSHVAPEFKWMARDEDGEAYLFPEKPDCRGIYWNSDRQPVPLANAFASYKRGTFAWEKSLVERPS